MVYDAGRNLLDSEQDFAGPAKILTFET